MASPHRRPADRIPTQRVYIEPRERRQALLDFIGRARRRLVLSLFRCNDYAVIDALADALDRGVKVEALLTKRAKGGKKVLKRLWAALEGIGARVHRYADPVVKYHAKYAVRDDRVALIASLNPTKKCFTRTWDFVYTTDDANIVRSVATLFRLDAAGEPILASHRFSARVIVGPEAARVRMASLINSARHSIQVLDHKLSDPDMVALLRARRDAGVNVSLIARQPAGPLVPHGKLLLLDAATAVLGSTALSTLSLDFRREVSVVVDDRESVGALSAFYHELTARAGGSVSALPGDRAA